MQLISLHFTQPLTLSPPPTLKIASPLSALKLSSASTISDHPSPSGNTLYRSLEKQNDMASRAPFSLHTLYPVAIHLSFDRCPSLDRSPSLSTDADVSLSLSRPMSLSTDVSLNRCLSLSLSLSLSREMVWMTQHATLSSRVRPNSFSLRMPHVDC